MDQLVEKLRTAVMHEAPPLEIAWQNWTTLLRGKGVEVDTLHADVEVYLSSCLFEQPLNLTFSLYSYAELKAFVEKDSLFPKAAAAGWFPIGDRDAVLICVAMDTGAVCLIPAWSVTEEVFEKEKHYKSLKTFFRGQIKHEKQAAQQAAEADQRRAAEKASLTELDDPNAVDDEGRTLLEFKPDVTLPDKEGKTAVDYLSLVRPKAKRLEMAKKIEDL